MLRLVDQMDQIPQQCSCCGGNPLGPDGAPQQAILAEGVDIDWGSSLYICSECANLIADFFGRVTQEEHDQLRQEYEELDNEHTKLLRKHSRHVRRTREVVAGEKAKKELRKNG
jgi:hypothetical protein